MVGSLFLGGVPDSSPVDQQLGAPVVLAMLVAWLAMSLSIALDQRAAGDDLAWDPTRAGPREAGAATE
ncbi:hypothetical protein EGH21_08545 [Halomicroarcula sp. F13]|uniref:Uncharacterized protein n=1 Tax=Haloarcula rubra TaxID=2487747 RepID=A0AAW4PQ00_9EURY|nr:hypothetical protein [Halomicroarcula rubra]MBX0323073.1 hypothetical protein [Halomicroarcula rubra]